MGDWACRDPSDPGRQPFTRTDCSSSRRRHPHRPRRGGRGAFGRRRVRLCHRAFDRRRLHHDAQVPSQHLPGRRRDARPGAAQALHRPARARHQLLLLRRRRGARADGRDGLPQLRRDDRPDADARPGQRAGARQGQWAGFLKAVHQATRAGGGGAVQSRAAGPQDPRHHRSQADRAIARRVGERHTGAHRIADPQHRPHHRRHAVRRDRQALRPRRLAARHHRGEVQGHRGPKLRRIPRSRRHASSSTATPTTMSARASRAAASWCARRRNPASCRKN